jgi:hypothetical protein
MATWMTRAVLRGLVAAAVITMAGCGGGSDNPPPAAAPGEPTPAVTGNVGGPAQVAPVTITGPGNAAIVVPPTALRQEVTIRIAQESTNAPALPAGARIAGAILAATPHGLSFNAPVRIELPLPAAPLAATEVYGLLKSQPGGQWEVVPGTVIRDGKISAEVTSFSFFAVVVFQVPTATFVPWQPTITLNCGPEGCNDFTETPEVTVTITSNRGALPVGCDAATARMVLAVRPGVVNSSYDTDPREIRRLTLNTSVIDAAVTSTVSLGRLREAAQAFDGTFTPQGGPDGVPNLSASRVNLVPYLECTDGAGAVRRTFYATQSAGFRGSNERWLNEFAPLAERRVDARVIRMDASPVDGQGRARVTARLAGGAFFTMFGGVLYRAPTGGLESSAAVVSWERSDDGGTSWTMVATSRQADGQPFVFQADPLIRDWRYWTVSHEFSAHGRTSGDVRFRVLACMPGPVNPFAARDATTICTRGAPIVIPLSGSGVAPVLSVSPRPVLILDGQTATFDATVTGTPAPTLQWQTRPANSNGPWADVTGGTGATAGTYTTPVLTLADNGRQYRVVATNSAGQIASAPVTASVTAGAIPAQITTQPANLSVAAGGDAVFAVSATGTEPLSYQWRRNGQNIAGANGAVLRLSSVAAGDDGAQLSVVVSNAAGTAQSQAAQLRVTAGTPAAVAPTIVTQPTGVTARRGQTVTFGVGINGTGPFSYQWRLNGNAIAGATAAVYSISSVADADAGNYSVVVSNSVGSVTSGAAALAITADPPPPTPVAPSITTQPAGLVVLAGNSATFAVAATGTGPLAYQWSRDGTEISGATGPVLNLASVQAGDAGSYTVRVSNAAGAVTSNGAQLIVPGAPVITSQSINVTGYTGQTATFQLSVVGNPAPSCQWLRNSVAIAGATSCTGYTTPPLTLADSGAVYNAVAYNAAGTVFGAGALLTVENPVAPVITTQPTSQTAPINGSAMFQVGFTSAPVATPAWRINGTELPLAFQVPFTAGTCTGGYSTAGGQLQLTGLSAGCDGAQVNVTLANFAGSATSNTVTLTVGTPQPTITQQPQNVSVIEGQPATFTAAVANAPYVQWERGGDIPGATSVTYTIPVTTLADNGAQFRLRACTLPGAVGQCVNSNFVTLTVSPSVPANALTATQVIGGYEWGLALRPDRSVWGWGGNTRTNGTWQSINIVPANRALRPVRMYPSVLSDVRQIAGWYDGFWALMGEPGSTSSRVVHWGVARDASDGRGWDGNGAAAGGGNSLPQFRYNDAAPVEVLTGVGQPVDRVCSIAGGISRLLLIRAIDDQGNTTNCSQGSAKTVWMVGGYTGILYAHSGLVQKMPGLPQSGAVGYSPPAVVFASLTSSNPDKLAIALEDGRSYGLGLNVYNGFGRPLSGGIFNSNRLGNDAGPEALRSEWGTVRSFGAAFYYSLFAIRGDGSVAVSGYNWNDELGLGDLAQGAYVSGPVLLLAETCASTPCAEALTGVTAIASAGTTTLALQNGRILGWGMVANGLLGPAATGVAQSYARPVAPGLAGVSALSAQHAHALAIGPGNVVYAWGSGLRGALGDGVDGMTRNVPTMVTVP